jgi:hypothetical protein
MTFWTDSVIEPKRSFRFIVNFLGMPGGASFYAMKCSKPQVEVGNYEHNFLNKTFNYPGRVKWSPVTMTVIDPGQPDAVQNLSAMLQASGYIIPGNISNTINLTTIGKNSAVNAAGNSILIKQLDALGNDIETWNLRNAWLKKFAPSELDYSNEDGSTVDLEIMYDWAELATLQPVSSELQRKLSDVGETSTTERFKLR